ncbi:hypothetical protein [Pseudoxanthomonas dokdonensis]|uniref:hypothetical protein n=1 Tax=Pseudoxanthomonas dokdonensis TaxID=344882 RepID=UPI00070D0228|nr:hypothetical protein [Pseudoxanthomonas dokdonensis]
MPAAGAIIGAAGSLIGGKMQSDAADSAANASAAGGQNAINAQLAMYNQSRADTLPYQQTGVGALNMLAGMYGLPTYQGETTGASGITMSGGEPTAKKKRSFFDKITDPANLAGQFGGTSYDALGLFSKGDQGGTTPVTYSIAGGSPGGVGGASTPGTGVADFSQFYQTPDYLVARDEGIQALDRGAAARGGLYSGGADADRMRFASNLGSQAFGNFQNNLFRLAGIGGQANSQLNSLGQNTAGQVGNQLVGIGNARASAYGDKANAWGNALNGVGTAAGQYFGNNGWGGQGSIGPVVREQIPYSY